MSKGTSPLGVMACEGKLRGQVPEHRTEHRVLSIGLFDGIGALRVALDGLGLSSIGHICVEKDAKGRRVVEAHFPDTIHYQDVNDITADVVKSWTGICCDHWRRSSMSRSEWAQLRTTGGTSRSEV